MTRSKRHRFTIIALIVIALIAIHDFSTPHGKGLAARGALLLIDEYRAHVSPKLRGVVTCRFTPSCSAYGRGAIAKYGFGKGSVKTALRISRCGPWTKPGTVDPP